MPKKKEYCYIPTEILNINSKCVGLKFDMSFKTCEVREPGHGKKIVSIQNSKVYSTQQTDLVDNCNEYLYLYLELDLDNYEEMPLFYEISAVNLQGCENSWYNYFAYFFK